MCYGCHGRPGPGGRGATRTAQARPALPCAGARGRALILRDDHRQTYPTCATRPGHYLRGWDAALLQGTRTLILVGVLLGHNVTNKHWPACRRVAPSRVHAHACTPGDLATPAPPPGAWPCCTRPAICSSGGEHLPGSTFQRPPRPEYHHCSVSTSPNHLYVFPQRLCIPDGGPWFICPRVVGDPPRGSCLCDCSKP